MINDSRIYRNHTCSTCYHAKIMPPCTTCLPETCFLLQNCVERNHCGEDEEGEAEDVPDVVKDAGLLEVDHL